jgi:mannitol/fructose-specific phosphotransferase system IIA component (Ntr-type)
LENLWTIVLLFHMASPALCLLLPEHTNLDIAVHSETDAINAVAEMLRDDPSVRDFEAFRAELFSREKLSPTALGSGVAFPHARTDEVSQIVLAVGRSREGIWFENCKQHVHLIFVIGTPKEAVREYLGVLASLAQLLKQKGVREALIQAATQEEFFALLGAGK